MQLSPLTKPVNGAFHLLGEALDVLLGKKPPQVSILNACSPLARAYLTKPLEVKKLFELLNEILQEQPSARDH